jgi:16S rRNA (cytidine1402-2'-O)-methyltransferase
VATLYIVATPIGNLEDVSARAVRILREVAVIACEDTRKTGRLLERCGIEHKTRMVAYHEHNEEKAGHKILELLSWNKSVALCSNAGYPGVSDPGYRVIADAIEAGHKIEVIPGASAVEPSLLSSGLPTSSFVFKGFPPRKPGPRRRFLAEDAECAHTLIIYESPYRTAALLAQALEVYGDRRAAVCVELTKMFESVFRGWLSELAAQFAEVEVRGEVTVVIAGNHPKMIRSGPGTGPSAPWPAEWPADDEQGPLPERDDDQGPLPERLERDEEHPGEGQER